MRDPTRGLGSVRAPGSILSYDIETVAPQLPDGSFPPWPTHRPVAIGFAAAWQDAQGWAFDIAAMVIADSIEEADLLREADRRMDDAGVVTGYNSRQFDALVLRLAAQKERLWSLKALANHAAANRFGPEHADLADLYASHGRKVGLAALCDEIGIPVKTSTSGGDVAALWEAGETNRIRDYVMEDAVATLCLFFAWTAARSGDEALVTQPMAALARHIEATPDLHHLHAFVDCTLMRWCRPRAMKADIAAALQRMTAKLRRQEDERAFAS